MRNIPSIKVHPSRIKESDPWPYQIFFQGKWLPVDQGVWEAWPGRCRLECKPAVGKVY